MGNYPCGADGVITNQPGRLALVLEHHAEWDTSDPTNPSGEVLGRVSGCLSAIEKGEVEHFAPGTTPSILIRYQHDLGDEVERVLTKVRENAHEKGVEVSWEQFNALRRRDS